MRILFAGTPAIGVPALQRLAESFDVLGVLTNPDTAVGRRSTLVASPVKSAALELGLPVLQHQRLGAEAQAAVSGLEVELLVVVAYGKILKDAFLGLFPFGGLNLHPSLLPLYRGPSPIPAAIASGDKETGVTVQRIAREVDSGNILAQERLKIEDTDTTVTVSERVSGIGARMLVEVVRSIEAGEVVDVEQDHSRATFCHLLTREDGRIDWSQPAAVIGRKVRAYTPAPGCHTLYDGRGLLIREAAAEPSVSSGAQAAGLPSGVVLDSDSRYGIRISTGKGVLCVSKLQLETKKMLDWRAFLNGNKSFIGARLGEWR